MPCRVVRIEEAASLPDLTAIAAAPSIVAVRAILAELHVSRVALIQYDVPGESEACAFVALETPDGWQDLTGNKLTITPEVP
jgi:hypothetical protein